MIAYFTVTQQTRRFVNKVDCPKVEIVPDNPFHVMDRPYLLVVPTYDDAITEPVRDFLETADNVSLCRGIFCGGNRNFAQLFCFTGKDLSRDYHLPLLHTFEFQGSDRDVAKLREELNRLAKATECA